ncbi:glutamine amidotransferase [Lentilactobacillus senioris]|uniref:glutamine amidotransferase n=1 Tax=Lentilactobacillus senioris TaxID=931534 RepID=UPI002281D66C|nr:glutamine amidotransferase [Lentilactobacillus senioris]MCY9807679.1 glutamine amidotransferase [Lentilactobacillus senioris]
MVKVLLAGESWISSLTEYKGYDSFTSTKLEIGCEQFIADLKALGHEITHICAHDVPEKFPWTDKELNQYDVVILSDIGSNSLLLSNKVFALGEKTPNRLEVLKQWVHDGGALMMAGGYLSFSGFEGKAHYHNSPIEDVLPVTISDGDDRLETPQGLTPKVEKQSYITNELGEFPEILGYQQISPKENSEVLMSIADDPLLIIGEYGKGKSLAYATDIAPHWASREFMDWNNYGEFFSRCMNWLANDLK